MVNREVVPVLEVIRIRAADVSEHEAKSGSTEGSAPTLRNICQDIVLDQNSLGRLACRNIHVIRVADDESDRGVLEKVLGEGHVGGRHPTITTNRAWRQFNQFTRLPRQPGIGEYVTLNQNSLRVLELQAVLDHPVVGSWLVPPAQVFEEIIPNDGDVGRN